MSSTRWGWGAADAADNIGEGENSSGIPDGLVGEDSRDGSQSAAKDDPKVIYNKHNTLRNNIHLKNIILYENHYFNFIRICLHVFHIS